MVIQPPKTFDLSTYNLVIDNVILTQTTSWKFRGITIDESLSWNKYILNINSKLSRAFFVIKQVKLYLPKESLHTLYYLLLHPHITWCDISRFHISENRLDTNYIQYIQAL